jgi:hypothetical protein
MTRPLTDEDIARHGHPPQDRQFWEAKRAIYHDDAGQARRAAERNRQILKLRLSSPKRSPQPQDDASACPLFVAANEPRLI